LNDFFLKVVLTKSVHIFFSLTKKVIISADIENGQRYLY